MLDIHIPDCFSATYQEARDKFLLAARDRQLSHTENVLPARRGLHDEALATDIVWIGPEDADRLLIVSSGIHGVEGFCGSGCQIALLKDDSLLDRAKDLGVAIAIIHAVNPHGFSYGRRVNEDNIDVNRNFLSFNGTLPENDAYQELASMLLPTTWPADEKNAAQLSRRIAEIGEDNYGQTLFRGQYDVPNGLFFGGTSPSWSNSVIRHFLRTRAKAAQQIAWIDLHTGLGPRGNCEKVFIGKAQEFEVASAWWGADVISPVRTDSVMFEINGPMLRALSEECSQAQGATIALEFGTVPLMRMLEALRADHWCYMNQEPEDSALRNEVREELRRCFFVEEDDWYGMVVGQFRTAVIQCLLGMDQQSLRTRTSSN
ncbi:M14 family metallopeptidase [Bordetella tumulicola]|uniref:M14 family metallopeptidase n=1 Tax=Bordetella tumulicola TaxID=1649133 RepID=UPI0039F0CA50